MNQSLAYSLSQVMPTAYRSGLMPSLATLQVQSQTQGSTGNFLDTWNNVDGLINIACQDAPESTARIQATEVKGVADILSKGMRHVLLRQFFPDCMNWSAKGYRCVIDGVVYDLLGAEPDSQSTQTRLDLQLATV